MQDTETVVLLHEDVVDHVGGLLGRFDILWPLGHELKDLVAAGKDTQQGREHGENGVADLGQNDLRAPVFLVSERVSQVVGHSLFALGRNIAINIGLGVLNGLEDRISELFLVHGLVQLGNKASLGVVGHIIGPVCRHRDQIGNVV